MRLIVFFDLPIETALQRKAYRKFRKFLIKDGFLMQQKSVYTKMVLDYQAGEAALVRLRKNKPKQGLVQVLRVTEKQFASIENIVGDSLAHCEIDSDEKLIVL